MHHKGAAHHPKLELVTLEHKYTLVFSAGDEGADEREAWRRALLEAANEGSVRAAKDTVAAKQAAAAKQTAATKKAAAAATAADKAAAEAAEAKEAAAKKSAAEKAAADRAAAAAAKRAVPATAAAMTPRARAALSPVAPAASARTAPTAVSTRAAVAVAVDAGGVSAPPEGWIVKQAPHVYARDERRWFAIDRAAMPPTLRYYTDESKAKEHGAIDLTACTIQDHQV